MDDGGEVRCPIGIDELNKMGIVILWFHNYFYNNILIYDKYSFSIGNCVFLFAE